MKMLKRHKDRKLKAFKRVERRDDDPAAPRSEQAALIRLLLPSIFFLRGRHLYQSADVIPGSSARLLRLEPTCPTFVRELDRRSDSSVAD